MKNQSVDILQCIVKTFSKFKKKDDGMNQFGRNPRPIGNIYLSHYQEAAEAFCTPFNSCSDQNSISFRGEIFRPVTLNIFAAGILVIWNWKQFPRVPADHSGSRARSLPPLSLGLN